MDFISFSPFIKGLSIGLFIGANVGLLTLGLLLSNRDRK